MNLVPCKLTNTETIIVENSIVNRQNWGNYNYFDTTVNTVKTVITMAIVGTYIHHIHTNTSHPSQHTEYPKPFIAQLSSLLL